MIEYSFNIKSLAQYDSDVFSDMCENSIDGRNGDEFYIMEQTIDINDEGYITFEGRWNKEIAEDGYCVDFKDLDSGDFAHALGSWRQDYGVNWEGTFTITKNGVSTVYDPEGNVKK